MGLTNHAVGVTDIPCAIVNILVEPFPVFVDVPLMIAPVPDIPDAVPTGSVHHQHRSRTCFLVWQHWCCPVCGYGCVGGCDVGSGAASSFTFIGSVAPDLCDVAWAVGVLLLVNLVSLVWTTRLAVVSLDVPRMTFPFMEVVASTTSMSTSLLSVSSVRVTEVEPTLSFFISKFTPVFC